VYYLGGFATVVTEKEKRYNRKFTLISKLTSVK
jgi:hypothetical protein